MVLISDNISATCENKIIAVSAAKPMMRMNLWKPLDTENYFDMIY